MGNAVRGGHSVDMILSESGFVRFHSLWKSSEWVLCQGEVNEENKLVMAAVGWQRSIGNGCSWAPRESDNSEIVWLELAMNPLIQNHGNKVERGSGYLEDPHVVMKIEFWFSPHLASTSWIVSRWQVLLRSIESITEPLTRLLLLVLIFSNVLCKNITILFKLPVLKLQFFWNTSLVSTIT